MLFGITSVLVASLSLGGGTALDVPEPVSFVSGQESAQLSDQPGQESSLLPALSGLSAARVADLVTANPERIEAILAIPPAPTTVTAWWSALPAAEQKALVVAAPRLVGNLNGLPLRERGRANKRILNETVAGLKRKLAGADPSARGMLAGRLAVLGQITAALHTRPDAPVRSLVLLDTRDGARAAIAIGDPDTADFVSYLVPGMNFDVEQQLVNWTATAQDLYLEQARVLARQNRPGVRFEVATIAWIGYKAPDVFSVGGLDKARTGADYLEKDWLGFQSSRGADQPVISVFAHSYGTTVSLLTLAHRGVVVDALVLVGSPGSPVQSVAELDVSKGRVYVGEADWDPAVNSSFFGSDPGGESYGARSLGVNGAEDRVTGDWLAGSLGHNAYFELGSESLHNMALIGTGNAELTTGGSE